MYRENKLQENIRWIIFATAGISALCNLIMLFSEFNAYSGVGMFLNGLFHLVAIACPALIFFLIYKSVDNNEIYSNYLFAIRYFFAGVADLCVMGGYIRYTQITKNTSIWIVLICILCALVEIGTGVLFIQYGLDNITPLLPLVVVFIACILRGITLNAVDEASFMAGDIYTKKEYFSIWVFIDLFIFLVMIICTILYFDSGFLGELFRNPKDIFTKNAILGTFSNLYDDEKIKRRNEKKRIKQENKQKKKDQSQLNNQNSQTYYQNNKTEIVGKCPDCNSLIYAGSAICNNCGCPASYKLPYISERNEDINMIKYICPDCYTVVDNSQEQCPKCGCPKSFMSVKPRIESKSEVK